MIAELKINDEVVTNGGIIGKIKEIRETSFIIQSAEKSFLEIGKSAVIGIKAEEKKLIEIPDRNSELFFKSNLEFESGI